MISSQGSTFAAVLNGPAFQQLSDPLSIGWGVIHIAELRRHKRDRARNENSTRIPIQTISNDRSAEDSARTRQRITDGEATRVRFTLLGSNAKPRKRSQFFAGRV